MTYIFDTTWRCAKAHISWCRPQIELFSALLGLCAGNSPVTAEFPPRRPVTWRVDVFFDLRLKKKLSKQSRRWWFETPSHRLLGHCNDRYSNGIQTLAANLLCWKCQTYRQTPNKSRTLAGNNIADHTDVGAASTFSFSTKHLASMDCKTGWETFKFWGLLILILDIWR